MSKRLIYGAVILVLAFAAAQLIRPERTNPAIDASRTIEAHVGTANGLTVVLDRACGDCHSNGTDWASYTQIAPVSWVISYAVSEGRKAVNFSEWGAYPPELQRKLLSQSCQDASNGKMPGSIYTSLRPQARLSAQDIETICVASRQAEAVAADGR